MDNSWKTAISRTKPSSPIQWLERRWREEHYDDLSIKDHTSELGMRLLDYGCGRGFDADYLGADKYDPYWFPTKPLGEYDMIFCTYVLNVVDRDEQRRILSYLDDSAIEGGVRYVTVRRDIPWGGVEHDGYKQYYVLDGDMKQAGYFSAYTKKNAYQIYVKSDFGDY